MKLEIGKTYKFGYLRNIDQPTVDTEKCFGVPNLYDYSENVKTYVGYSKVQWCEGQAFSKPMLLRDARR